MIPYYSQRQGFDLEKRVDELETGGKSSKHWLNVTLSESDFQSIQSKGESSFRLPRVYEPTTFTNDYIQLSLTIDSEVVGTPVISNQELSRLYVNFKYTDIWCNEWMRILFSDVISRGAYVGGHSLGFIYASVTGDAKDSILLDTNDLFAKEFGEGTQKLVLGIETASSSGIWDTSTDCPLADRWAWDEFNDGEAWVGYDRNNTYILVYKLNNTFYYAAARTNHTVQVSGLDLDLQGKGQCIKDINWAEEAHISADPLVSYNIIYLVDVTSQEWNQEATKNSQEGNDKDIRIGRVEELKPQSYGKQFVVVINGKDTRQSYLMVFENDKLPVLGSDHTIREWKDTEKGKVYHVTWDDTAVNYSLGAELTEAEVDALFETGIEFNSVKGSEIVEAQDGKWGSWSAYVAGDKYRISESGLSKTPFEEPEEGTSMKLICRPQYIFVDRVSYLDPDSGKPRISIEGGYVWSGEIEGTPLTVTIPAADPTVGIVQISMSKDTSSGLYRHTIRIDAIEDGMYWEEDIKCHICFTAVNNQLGDPTPEYLLYSDTADGWSVSASGCVIVGGAAFIVNQVETKIDDRGDWALVAHYTDNAGTPAEVTILRPSNLGRYQVTNKFSEIR